MKKGINLTKGVSKFVQYNRDLMNPDKLARVRNLQKEYELALRQGDRAQAELLEKDLVSACEGSVTGYKSSAVKENIEVIVVAIVVALGIRAYFLQPFKIPTASMQPTLNGITAAEIPVGTDFPNPIVRGLEYIGRGRNYVEMQLPAEWGTVSLIRISQRSTMHFFTVTDLTFVDAARRERVLTAYAPARHLWDDLWIGPKPAISRVDEQAVRGGADKFTVEARGAPLPGGTMIARGYIDTGDQVLVNKMAYHFRRPDRGEVFVFSTAGIKGIVAPPGIDSQHYIKRLTAVPNDRVRLVLTNETVTNAQGRPLPLANLHVNGANATEEGMQKVMARQNGYKGYTAMDTDWLNFVKGDQEIQLNGNQYLAMGDNSPDSSDSRYWGPVPEKNLVGPALFVYWPFLPHFGLIR